MLNHIGRANILDTSFPMIAYDSPIVDATFIVSGGGLALLKTFISRIDSTERRVLYLVDSRLRKDPFFARKDVRFVSGFLEREFFFIINFACNRRVLHFNNIGSIFVRRKFSYIYFHNVLYLADDGLKIPLLKRFLFYIGVKTANSIFVQTRLVMDIFSQKFPAKEIIIAPFFLHSVEEIMLSDAIRYQGGTDGKSLIYPASHADHKRHESLADAVHYFEEKSGEALNVYLTVSPEIFDKFSMIVGYHKCKRVINLGRLTHEDSLRAMSSVDLVVHPSKYESFGLVLIEAAMLGRAVVAPDLEYVKEVVSTHHIYRDSADGAGAIDFAEAIDEALKNPVPAKLNVADKFQFIESRIFD